MTIMELGALGEFVGSIGVVVTLVYLAVQIRQNTGMMRTQTIQARVDSFQTRVAPILSSSEFTSLVVRGDEDPSSLDEIEARQYRTYAQTIFRSWQANFESYRYGMMSQQDKEGTENAIRFFLSRRGFRQSWETMQGTLPSDFQAWINSLSDSAETSLPAKK